MLRNCGVIRARANAAYVECKNREEEQKAKTLHASLRRHYPNRFQGFALTDPHTRGKDP